MQSSRTAPLTVLAATPATAGAALRDPATPWHFAGPDRTVLAGMPHPAGPEVTGPPLGVVADRLADEYLERMGAIAASAPSPWWWGSTAGAKQVGETCVMSRAASVVRALDIARDHPETLIVCGDALTEGLVRGLAADALPGPGAHAVVSSRALFIGAHLRRIAATSRAFPDAAGTLAHDGVTLLVTWFDRRSIDADGRFHDPYFGDLPQRLADSGTPFAIVPIIVPGTDEAWALKAMRDCGMPFVPAHALLTPTDVRRASSAGDPVPPAGAGTLAGVPLAPLIAADHARDRGRRAIWFDRLLAMVPARLSAAGVEVARVVMPFENIAWEKLFIIGARQAWPSVVVAGHQHSSICRRKTSYLMSPAEEAVAPLPDIIVTSGPAATRLLEPFYGERVVSGGALRYAGALGSTPHPAPVGGHVLVVLSLDRGDAAETLRTCAEALGTGSRRVIVKAHPAGDLAGSLAAAGLASLPPAFSESPRPVPELLEEADLVIASSSTAVLEALAVGVPVVQLELAASIVVSPLVDAPGAARWAYGADELRMAVDQVTREGEAGRDAGRETWSATVRGILAPADEATYTALLGDPA